MFAERICYERRWSRQRQTLVLTEMLGQQKCCWLREKVQWKLGWQVNLDAYMNWGTGYLTGGGINIQSGGQFLGGKLVTLSLLDHLLDLPPGCSDTQ